MLASYRRISRSNCSAAGCSSSMISTCIGEVVVHGSLLVVRGLTVAYGPLPTITYDLRRCIHHCLLCRLRIAGCRLGTAFRFEADEGEADGDVAFVVVI